MILDTYLNHKLISKYQVIHKIKSEKSNDTLKLFIGHSCNCMPLKVYIKNNLHFENNIYDNEFDYTKNYEHITKLLIYSLKIEFDLSIFPNLKLLYINGCTLNNSLTGINKNIECIIFEACNNMVLPYLKDLNMLFCLKSKNGRSKDLIMDYHNFKKDNINWCNHPYLIGYYWDFNYDDKKANDFIDCIDI